MLWWLLPTLLAAEPPTPDAPAASGPEVRRTAVRRYPKRAYPDRSRTLTCDVEVTLDGAGVPRDVDASACEPTLAPWAEKIAGRDRWRGPVADGTRVRVPLRFAAPADSLYLAAPDTWRFRDEAPCEVRLQVPDGGAGAWVRAATPGCAPELPADLPVRVGRVPAHPPGLCPVTFVRDDAGQVGEVDVFRCPLGSWQRARALVNDVAWPVAAPYVVLLSLGGEAAPPPVSGDGDGD